MIFRIYFLFIVYSLIHSSKFIQVSNLQQKKDFLYHQRLTYVCLGQCQLQIKKEGGTKTAVSSPVTGKKQNMQYLHGLVSKACYRLLLSYKGNHNRTVADLAAEVDYFRLQVTPLRFHI